MIVQVWRKVKTDDGGYQIVGGGLVDHPSGSTLYIPPLPEVDDPPAESEPEARDRPASDPTWVSSAAHLADPPQGSRPTDRGRQADPRPPSDWWAAAPLVLSSGEGVLS